MTTPFRVTNRLLASTTNKSGTTKRSKAAASPPPPRFEVYRDPQHPPSFDDDSTFSSTFQSQWRSGDVGQQWKQRYLDERRSRAHDYLFDITKRVPIHNSVRQHSEQSSSRLSHLHAEIVNYDPDLRDERLQGGRGGHADVMHDVYRMEMQRQKLEDDMDDEDRKEAFRKHFGYDDDTFDVAYGGGDDGEVDDEAHGEGNLLNALDSLSSEDIALLMDEFYPKTYGASAEENEIMGSLLRVRKGLSESKSFAHLPEQERNTWSAWYLRHMARKDD
eukprot:PhM_4_TR10320/c0_g1_i1/m.20013